MKVLSLLDRETGKVRSMVRLIPEAATGSQP
jgi:hypothetical protein